jgi:hypothetical protein
MQSNTLPDWIKFSVALIVLGAIANGIHALSPSASYLFVTLVLLGYAGTGGRAGRVTEFFTNIGVIAKVK